MALLNDPRRAVCSAAVTAVARIDPTGTESLPVLVELARNGDAQTSKEAIRQLGQLGMPDPLAIQVLIEVVAQGTGTRRRLSVDSLGKMQSLSRTRRSKSPAS